MANEISYTLQANLSNSGLIDNFSSGSLSADQANARMIRNVQQIGTTAGGEALQMGDVTGNGIAIFKNLDDTNFVEIGRSISAAFEAFLRLLPGESALLRLSTTAPYAKADTSAVELDYRVYEE